MLNKEHVKQNLFRQIIVKFGIVTPRPTSPPSLPLIKQKSETIIEKKSNVNYVDLSSESTKVSSTLVVKRTQEIIEENIMDELVLQSQDDINLVEGIFMLNNKGHIPIEKIQEFELLKDEIADLDQSIQKCFMHAEQLQNKIVSENWFVSKNSKKLTSIEDDISEMVDEMQQMKHEHKSLTLKQRIYLTKIRRLKLEPLTPFNNQ